MRNLAVVLSITACPAYAEPVTVAALGDSLTQGYGLPAADGLVPQLEKWLQSQGRDAVVLNAGVSGDTTAGGLSRADWTLTPEVDALILALGGNDLLRGIDPATSRANLDAILQKAQARGLPVLMIGLRASGNFGPEYKAAFDGMYTSLAAQYGADLIVNFFQPLADAVAAGADTAGVRADVMQPDGIHPNATGVAMIVEAIGPRVLALIDRVE